MIKNLSIPSKFDVRFARAAALCLFAFAAAVIAPAEARAQWTTAGSNTTTTSNVGVGTTAPATSLHVSTAVAGTRGIIDEQTSADANSALFYFRKSRAGAAAQNGDNIGSLFASAFDGASFVSGSRLRFAIDGPVAANSVPTAIQFLTGANADGVERMRISSNGNVGIGTDTPGVLNGINYGGYISLHIKGQGSVSTLVDSADPASGYVLNDRSQPVDGRIWAISQVAGGGKLTFSTYTDAGAPASRLVIDRAGNVGIGTAAPTSKLHVAGNITIDGNINAKWQDVAEWVPSTQKLSAGTVVVLDVARDNHVAASFKAYDTRVAGVVSAQPGLTLGEAGEGKALVATTGRVKVRVDATRAPIQIGDLIVTSDVPGMAMKSEPVSFGGVEMHRPGTIIGKALESLEKGTGEILVLLSLQ
ncbi:MAG: hypothetical protein QOH49_3702 [Acidobacteriota bacterium]|nr:hypothetical protein [Acidobacteriota bacterium]